MMAWGFTNMTRRLSWVIVLTLIAILCLPFSVLAQDKINDTKPVISIPGIGDGIFAPSDTDKQQATLLNISAQDVVWSGTTNPEAVYDSATNTFYDKRAYQDALANSKTATKYDYKVPHYEILAKDKLYGDWEAKGASANAQANIIAQFGSYNDFIWVEGLEGAGTVILPFDRYDHVYIASGDYDNPTITETFDYTTMLGKTYVNMPHFSGVGGSWITGFDYRKSFNVTGSTVSALEDYQMRVVVHKAMGTDAGCDTYVGDHIQDDFDDVRFTNSTGGSLDYWRSEYTAGTEATFWIELDDIAIGANVTQFSMTYGNASASTESNGFTTWIVYGDGATLSGWTIQQISTNNWGWAVGSGYYNASVGALASAGSYLWNDTAVPDDYRIGVKAQQMIGLSGSNVQHGLGHGSKIVDQWTESRWVETNNNFYLWSAASGANNTFDARNWHNMETLTYLSNWTYSVDGLLRVSKVTATNGNYVGLLVYSHGIIDWVHFDDFYCGKYVLPEPVISAWGNEESAPPMVETNEATDITATTANLIGNVTYFSGVEITDRGFEWSNTTGIPYETNWTANGNFGLGVYNHTNVTFSTCTQYFYRAMAINTNGTWGYGTERNFTTTCPAPTGMDAPGNFTATEENTTAVWLNWTIGAGAVNTLITRNSEAYPVNRTDGFEIYNGTGTTVNDTMLSLANTAYYYRAWSYNGTATPTFTTDYAQVQIGGISIMTTMIVILGLGLMIPAFIWKKQALMVSAAFVWVGFAFYNRTLSPTWGSYDIYEILFYVGIVMVFLCTAEAILLARNARSERLLGEAEFAKGKKTENQEYVAQYKALMKDVDDIRGR